MTEYKLKMSYITNLWLLREHLDYIRQSRQPTQYADHGDTIDALLDKYQQPKEFLDDLRAEWDIFRHLSCLLDRFLEACWGIPVDSLSLWEFDFAKTLHLRARLFNKSKYFYSLTIKPMIEREVGIWSQTNSASNDQLLLAITPMMGSFFTEEYLGLAELLILQVSFGADSVPYCRLATDLAGKFYVGSHQYLQSRMLNLGLDPADASAGKIEELRHKCEELRRRLQVNRLKKFTLLSQYPVLSVLDDLLYFDHFTEQTHFSNLYTAITSQVMPSYLEGNDDVHWQPYPNIPVKIRHDIVHEVKSEFDSRLADLCPKM